MAAASKVTLIHETPGHGVRSFAVPRPAADVVYSVNKQRRALLAEIDNARFSWFHLRVAFVSGVGFFADAYDIFSINIVAAMLGYCYGADEGEPASAGRALSAMQELAVKVATPVGIIIGQLLFGWLGDRLGRKRIYGLELIIIIIGTFGQTMTCPASAISFVGTLTAWRLFMGIGIGGDYPLSAVISSEFSSTYIRGRVMTAVFANQGWGQLAATAVSCVVVRSYRDILLGDQARFLKATDQMWRIIVGLGCIPAVVALYFRLTIPETPRFTIDIEHNVRKAALSVDALMTNGDYVVDRDAAHRRVTAQNATQSDFCAYFSRWQNLKVLLGTSYSWFALDIAFYGLGLNSSTILNAIGFGTSVDGPQVNSAYENLKNASVGNLILSLAGFIPGYWATFLVIDRWGRKSIQMMGFVMLTALLVGMGFAYNKMVSTTKGHAVFVSLYCLANFFQNFGPNTTTFIVPGEAFPTRYRSTAHGISAASGKIGAVVAQVVFQWLKDVGGTNAFIGHILQIFGFFMLTGVVSTMLIPETNQKTLEVLSNEPQDRFLGVLDRSSRHLIATPRLPVQNLYPMTRIKLSSLGQIKEPAASKVLERMSDPFMFH
ncbi:phosphate transporter [Wolfiporia cocos MD-104 SS10]|uniref:Phosphate transporter n=1 Tax=Wolfiporia cocos (strain MD-104) TaxID=742152 RepID=A0A2H3JL07_WOLCO|nr:phosphate transporter [Wolfiporia cocos MD-104 SS10]